MADTGYIYINQVETAVIDLFKNPITAIEKHAAI